MFNSENQMHAEQAVPGGLDDYYESLKADNLPPLWQRLKGLVPSEPRPVARSHHWSFQWLLPRLLRAGELITAEEAERRVLILENPGLPGESKITDTLYSGVQLLLPGEVAPAHRHSQSALRFVLKGEGAFTSVDGERAFMHPGDFIVTPQMTWHDHGHEGTEPVIWIDGLDVPLVTFLRAGFREEAAEVAQIVTKPDGDALARFGMGLLPIDSKKSRTTPMFSYPYTRTREALHTVSRTGEVDPHFGICLRYTNPTNGDWAIPTIATSMRLLPKGFRSLPYRSTDGVVFSPTEGHLRVSVGGAVYDVMPKDVVTVPAWTDYTLEAVEADTVVFAYSDRPVHEKFGLWRERKGEA